MIKKGIFGLLLCAIISTSAYPIISYDLKDFMNPGTKSSFGVIVVKDKPYFKAGLSPDMQFGPLGLGLDINLYVPLTSNDSVPSEMQWLNFRMLSYDHYDIAGIKWGRLTNIEYGYGLLMDKYDSGSAGSSQEFNTKKAATEVYYNDKTLNIGIRAMASATNVKALRVQYTVGDNIAFGKPLIIGGNYIEDSDGVYIDQDNVSQNIKPYQKAYSVDAGIPIFDKALRAYTEVARLENQGDGGEIGLGGSLQPLEYKVAYRILAKGFCPGYFGKWYEANVSANYLTKDTQGLLAYAGISFMDDYIKTGIMYEAYESQDPIVSWAIGWRKLGPTIGVVNFTRSMSDQNGGVADASIFYEGFPYMPFPADAILSVRRIYRFPNNFDNFDQTFSITVQPNLNKMFPGIPFLF
jgi:hypothetical protein